MGISIKQSLTTVLDIHCGPFILHLLHSDSNSMSIRDWIDLNNILDGEHNQKCSAKALEADNLNSNMQTKKRNKNPITTNTPTKQSLSSQISTKNTSITNGGEDLSTPGADTTIELTHDTSANLEGCLNWLRASKSLTLIQSLQSTFSFCLN